MAENPNSPDEPIGPPAEGKLPKIARAALQVVSGAIPFAGGALSAVAGAWSEAEQAKANRFFQEWLRMLQDELREKEQTVVEMMARLDLQDEKIAARVESREFQSLVKKAFRDWGGAESEEKRVLIRNILSNAAAGTMVTDDVVRIFIDWIDQFSELHFKVMGAIYNSAGITRGGVWRKVGKGQVREDSAEADLYKLLFRDLSTGGVIRQHRETDYYGRPIAKTPSKREPGSGPKPAVSAFDENEQYELTELGKQFIHYAMTDLPTRIDYKFEPHAPEGDPADAADQAKET